MAGKPKENEEPRRLNRTVGVGDALGGVLDSMFKKRGFATRDIVTQWAAMAPKPYDKVAIPEQLKWARGAGHEGATLYLRCMQGHAMALSHEGGLIAAAVNRYFGYFLVREVRLSAEPFSASVAKAKPPQPVPAEAVAKAGEAAAEVADDGLRSALEELGKSVLSKRTR